MEYLESEKLLVRKYRGLTPEEEEELSNVGVKGPYDNVKYCWSERKPVGEWTIDQLRKATQILSAEVDERVRELTAVRQRLLTTGDEGEARELRRRVQLTARVVAKLEEELERLDAELQARVAEQQQQP